MKKYQLLFIIVSILLFSCQSKNRILVKNEMIRYLNNKKNGLVQEQEINGIKVRLLYQPSDMMVVRELETYNKKDPSFIREVETKYKDNYYFLLQFSKDGQEVIRRLGSFGRYSDMVQVFSFQMKNFVNLTTPQKDTVELADYLFEQTYGMSNGNTILLSFEKNKIHDKPNIDINLGECGLGIGNLRFRFEKENLDRIPALDFDHSL